MSDMDPSERWRQIRDSQGRQPSDEAPTQLGGPPPTGAGPTGPAADPWQRDPSSGPAPDQSYGQGYPPSYGQPYGAHQPYGDPHGYPYAPGQVAGYAAPYPQFPIGYGAVAPQHPSAGTALTLGLVGLIGGLMCYLPLFAAPFAWVTGARAVREIDAAGGQLAGRGQAQAGMICGIIGTAILVLGVVGMALLIVGIASSS